MRKVLYIFLILHFGTYLGLSQQKQANGKHNLILVSLDGFGCRLHNEFHLPNLKKVAKDGTLVQYVRNVFPTNTLPNHISIISGLYPENHGMIDNRMLNEETGQLFIMDDRGGEEWWNGFEPIWWTNQKQGYQSSVFFWPGYNVKINGHLPTYGPSKTDKPPFYDNMKNLTIFKMVDKAFDQFDKYPNLTLTLLYIEEPDETLHQNPYTNMESKKKLNVKLCLSTVDEFVGYVQNKLKEKGRSKTTNVIYIGDHGHVNTNHEQVINLEKFINTTQVLKYMIGFTNAFLYPKEGQLMRVYSRLKNAHKHMKVYLKKDIPDNLHIKHNKRTGPILVLPDPGWVLWADIENISYLKGKFYRGEHGYINTDKRMNPTFLAVGPDIKHNFRKESINTVDVYELMCHLLGIQPSSNDGSMVDIRKILRNPNGKRIM